MISKTIQSIASNTQRRPFISSSAANKQFKIYNKNTYSLNRTFTNKFTDFIKYAYDETFGDENDFKKKQQKNKEAYLEKKKAEEEMMKDYTEEELAEFAEKIPEWKRTSLTETAKEPENLKLSKKLKLQLMKKIEESDAFKELRETDTYKEWKDEMKESGKSYDVFKGNVQQKIDSAQNPIVKGASGIYNKLREMSRETSEALGEMKRRDPTFDHLALEENGREIFEQVYTTFLQKDLELIDQLCSDTAQAHFKSQLRIWEVKEIEPKYPFLWDIDTCFFSHANMEKGEPHLTYTLKAQQIHCLQYTKENSEGVKEIEDGADDRLQTADYIFSQSPNYEADVELIGHSWKMTSQIEIGKQTMIV